MNVATDKAAHLAWCALTAAFIARHDGVVTSEAQENLFITRWLAEAKRQRRFSREVAQDIDWLLKLGRTAGLRAGLRSKLDYLWRACSGNLKQQNDLFRLTYAMDTARENQWIYRLLTDSEWQGRNKIRLNPDVNGICLLRRSLDSGFDEEGQQKGPLVARITGNADELNALLQMCNWAAKSDGDNWQLTAETTA